MQELAQGFGNRRGIAVILIIDNKSLFLRSLVELTAAASQDCRVIPAEAVSITEISSLKPSGIILGPGLNSKTRMAANQLVVEHFSGNVPILGIDVGMHAIVAALGGGLIPSEKLSIGCQVSLVHDQRGVFEGISSPMLAGCFSNHLVSEEKLPRRLSITAHTLEGEIMAVRGRSEPRLEGLQFCPESILTPRGRDIIENFVEITLSCANGLPC
jgi:anthranilate synthase/aminodeoxychorismate synthase-like glutamine amidotransferase